MSKFLASLDKTNKKLLVSLIILSIVTLILGMLYIQANNQRNTLVNEKENMIRSSLERAYRTSSYFIKAVDGEFNTNPEGVLDMEYWFASFDTTWHIIRQARVSELDFLYRSLTQTTNQYDIEEPQELEMLTTVLVEFNKDIMELVKIYLGKAPDDIPWDKKLGLMNKVEGKDKVLNRQIKDFFLTIHERYYIDIREKLIQD